MKSSLRPLFIASIAIGGLCVGSLFAQPANESTPEDIIPTLPADWVEAMQWRSIGPANMSGRITAIAVYEADPNTYWLASASGGLLKTTNNGVTFEHQFDDQATVSIGDVQVCQSDPDLVWVGTGEHNPRNSASWGNGVYKSTDGGTTWTHMGLDKTFQTGRIQIHPENPDIVYVGAMGRLWGPNEERGLYKTNDGGETWEKILYVDEKTGVIDVKLKPDDPDTILVATYERQRDGFDGNDPEKKWGPGSGIYKTTDGGATWSEITDGLPTVAIGRIGIDWYRKDPSLVYVVLESEKIGKQPENAPFAGLTGEDADVGARLTQIEDGGPAAKAGLKVGDIIISLGGETVHSWDDLQAAIRRHLAGETVGIEVSRDREGVEVDLTFDKLPGAEEDEETESGDEQAARERRRRNRSPFDGGLGGQRENVQDQQGPDGHEFGGVYMSDDAGDTWKRINSLNPRPMYYSEIRVDPSDNNYIWVLGTSLYRSDDGGETFADDAAGGGVHVDHHAMWVDHRDGRHVLLGNDGGHYVTYDRGEHWEHLNKFAIGQFYHVGIGPRRNYMVYGGLQDNGSWGGPSRTKSGGGPLNADWFRIGGGDGFICLVDPDDPDQLYSESQNGSMGRYNLRTGERGFIRPRPPRGERYRWNWKTPFILSHHNSEIHYSAGNKVFRSIKKGDDVQAISPDITNDEEKGAGSALAESPLDENVLYVGTTCGALHMTKNGGKTWIDLFDLPAEEAEPEDAAADGAPDGARRGRGGRGPGGSQMRQRIMERDANGDGKIQKDEVPERMVGLFDRLDANDDGELDEEELNAMGQMMRGGERPPQAEGDEPTSDVAQEKPAEEQPAAEAEEETVEQEAEAIEDVVSGRWTARLINENISGEQAEASFTLKMSPDGSLTGSMRTAFSDGEIYEGKYDPEDGSVTFSADMGQMGMVFTGRIEEGTLNGNIDVGGGMFQMGMEATLAATGEGAAEEQVPAGKPMAELMPGNVWVSSLTASRFEPGRVYVTFDGHRSDLDDPFVFVSEDFGRTWRSLRANLPIMAGSTRVIREDPHNENLLYLGCEFSCWVSIDRGESWTKFNSNLPTVAVHEIAIHPTAGEIVAGTHGRSLWIMDATALRQMSAEAIESDSHLYRPNDGIIWHDEPGRGNSGLQSFEGENPPGGTQIYYSLGDRASDVELEITDARGRKIIRFEDIPTEPGLHRITWNLRRAGSEVERRGRRFRRPGPLVAPGDYLVVLRVDGEEQVQLLEVMTDPEHPAMDVTQLNRQEMLDVLFAGEEEETRDDD